MGATAQYMNCYLYAGAGVWVDGGGLCVCGGYFGIYGCYEGMKMCLV